MADFPAAIGGAVDGALFGATGAPTLMAVLLAIYFWLGAHIQIWSGRRTVATGLRVAGLLTVLGAIVVNMHRAGWLHTIDTATTSWMVGHRSRPLNAIASVLIDATSPIAVAAAAVVSAAAVSRRARSVAPAVVILGTVVAAGVAGAALTALVSRPRPPLRLQLVSELAPSFPAIHVTGAATLLGVLAVCADTGGRHVTRFRIRSAVSVAVAVTAGAGVYSATHWLSEVIAATLLAAALVIVSAATLNTVQSGGRPGSAERAAQLSSSK